MEKNHHTLFAVTIKALTLKGARDISIMIHHPKDIETQQELTQRVAAVHAQAVIEKIKSMPYPAEQKVRLIDAIRTYIPK